MNNYFKQLALLILFLNFSLSAQKNVSSSHIENVFKKLVSAYGNAKSAPKLIISKGNKLPAIYYSSPNPTIEVDSNLYSLCNKEFGAKTNDALAIIIGHELAHYYNDHTFCSDFAFAIRKESNLSTKLKVLSKTEKIALETEADHKGLFFACMAGYKPFDIYSKLLDAIYNKYKLSNEIPGYPSKNERKSINLLALKKVKKLYISFKSAKNYYKKGYYDKAIKKFESINMHFPSRENYNNIGVCKTLKALKFKSKNKFKSKKGNQFKSKKGNQFNSEKNYRYILTVDYNSQLKQSIRYSSKNNAQLMKALLKSAQKDFEKAISLDDNYTQSYINLACVFDLLDIPSAAIGEIRKLQNQKGELKGENYKKSQMILAIAYYHDGSKGRAEKIWKKVKY